MLKYLIKYKTPSNPIESASKIEELTATQADCEGISSINRGITVIIY